MARMKVKPFAAVAALVGVIVGVVSIPSYWPNFVGWWHGGPAPVIASDAPRLQLAGGDNNGGGVFLRNSPIVTYGPSPDIHGGKGGQYGAGGPASLENSPILNLPTPPKQP
jgi:hypothetical protein